MSKKPTYEELEQRVKELEREVVKREQVEEAFRESQEIFSLFMEYNPIYTFFKDENLRSLRLSKNYEQMLGMPIDELLGKTMDELFPSDLAKSMIADDQRILKEGKTITVEEELDGRVYETIKFPIFIDDKPKYLSGYTIDITERKRIEEALEQRTRDLGERVKELNCLYGISNLVEKPDFSLEEVLQGVVELIPPSWQYPEITCSRIILEEKEYKTENFRETEWKQANDIFVYGKKVGTLEIYYLKEKPKIDEGPFLGEERNLINAITERLGRITERIQAEKALRDSEERLSSFMNSASDSMYLLDSDLNFVEVNRRGLEIIGKKKKKVVGKNMTDIVPEVKKTGIYEKHLEVLKTGKSFEVEDFVSHPIFGDLHFILKSFKAGDGLGVIASDITDRKHALERVERLNRLKEELIVSGNLEGKLKRITEEVVRIFEADFCRVWSTMPGDICDSGCLHAEVIDGPHVCRDRERCLHLIVSSGRYTHVDGGHRRVPLGAYMIGRIASGEEAEFITNDITSDPRVHDHGWAKRHGLISFTGYRLLSSHGDPIGVLALFSKKPISPDEHALLKGIANTTAQVIQVTTAEEELRESEENLKTLFDNLDDFLFILNSEGRIINVNPVVLQRLGYLEEEILKRPVPEIQPPDRREEAAKIISDILEGKVSFCPVSLLTKDGRLIPVETKVSRGKWSGQDALFGISRDITQRKIEEEERNRLEAQLQQAKKMEAIATLAGGIAHQFNNALSPITANLDMLEMDYPNDENINNYIEQMRGSAQRMGYLTSQLLAYARGGKYQAKIISMNNFVRETLPLIEHTLKPSVFVETDLPHDILGVHADSTQMQMVLSAILFNASEAIEDKGRIRVICRNKIITDQDAKDFHDLKPGTYVRITIEDDGKGMDKETREKIFEPFFTTKFQGRGLGMAAAYGIVKHHDGWISVDSEPGKGTTVQIYLPAMEEEKKIKEAKKSKIDLPKGTGTVLMIEDEEMIMNVTHEILERLGYRFLGARNGKEAVDIAKTFDGVIDLALLDIKLPDMDGVKIYPLIKEARPDMKVIVCSGYAIDGPVQEILDAGAQDFVQKPFTLAEISEKLKTILEGK